ncbi:tail length tape-measure protein [Aeromonas phage 59.1]|nr:tail length tape-measure protein [Aeromonas phage 59.1]
MKENKRLTFIMDMVDKITTPATNATKSLKVMGEDVTTTQKKLAAFNKQAGDIKSLEKMRGEMSKHNATTKELGDKVGELKVKMALAEKPTRAMQTAINRATKEHDRAKASTAAHKDALHKLESGLKRAGVDTNDLTNATRINYQAQATSTNELRKQQRALDAATKKQDNLTKAKERYTKAEEQSHKAMAAGSKMALAGAALTGGIVAAGAPNYGFQKQMSAVQALGDFSSAEKAALTASARAEAKVSSFGAAEAGQAQGYLAAAGFKVEQIQQSLKGVLDLAAATETGLAETADISSNILSGFGLGADQMGRVGDVLTATTSGHNVNLQMLGESMKYVAPIAKQTGQSLESIGAMTGLLGDVGIQGSMAGTALKGAMLRLAGPTRDAQKAFDKLKVSTKDANGNVRAMPDVLEELQRKMKGMGSGDKLALLKRMFGEEPAAAIATLLDKAGDTIAEKTKRLQNSQGAADRSARNRLNNLWGDVENFKSSLEDAQIEFGGLLDNMMRGIVRLAMVAVDAANNWMQKNPKLARALALVAAAIGGLLSVTGTLIVVLGSLWLIMAKCRLAMFLFRTMVWSTIKAIAMKTWAVSMFLLRGAAMLAWFAISKTAILAWNVACVAMRGIMVALTAAQWLWNAALTANPIGAVVMAVVALVAAGVWLYENWERLPEIFDNLWAKVTEFVGFNPLEMIKGAWDAVGDYFTGLFGGIWDSFMGVFNKIGDKLSALGSWATGGFGMLDPEVVEQVKDAPKAGDTSPKVDGKPLAKGSQVTQTKHQTVNVTPAPVTITINASGGDANEIARQIKIALDQRDREAAREARGAYRDT